jgi:hypothetical protein
MYTGDLLYVSVNILPWRVQNLGVFHWAYLKLLNPYLQKHWWNGLSFRSSNSTRRWSWFNTWHLGTEIFWYRYTARGRYPTVGTRRYNTVRSYLTYHLCQNWPSSHVSFLSTLLAAVPGTLSTGTYKLPRASHYRTIDDTPLSYVSHIPRF